MAESRNCAMDHDQWLLDDPLVDVHGIYKEAARDSPTKFFGNTTNRVDNFAKGTTGDRCEGLINIRRDLSTKAAILCNSRPLEAAADDDDDQLYPPQLRKLKFSESHKAHELDVQQGDAEQEDAEGLCVTPTAKEQRIPLELVLVCPPAPKKRKPSAKCVSKLRKRPLIYSHELPYDHAIINNDPQYTYLSSVFPPPITAAQRRCPQPSLVVRPPDLHTLPACIRALFNNIT